MKKSKKKISTLKRNLWELTSRYVRLSAADHTGLAQCVTCKVYKPWQDLDAGHFIAKNKGLSIYYDLRNIHPQCNPCNRFLRGNLIEYFIWMEENLGRDVINKLIYLSGTELKLYHFDYEKMITDLKEKLGELENGS